MSQKLVKAELRGLFSPDADPLKAFEPSGPFGILVQAMIGPAGEKGQESFDFVVCTPIWFASRMEGPIVSGHHHLFVQKFDYAILEKYVRAYCLDCVGPSWPEVAKKISRLGKWEFEDYQP